MSGTKGTGRWGTMQRRMVDYSYLTIDAAPAAWFGFDLGVFEYCILEHDAAPRHCCSRPARPPPRLPAGRSHLPLSCCPAQHGACFDPTTYASSCPAGRPDPARRRQLAGGLDRAQRGGQRRGAVPGARLYTMRLRGVAATAMLALHPSSIPGSRQRGAAAVAMLLTPPLPHCWHSAASSV